MTEAQLLREQEEIKESGSETTNAVHKCIQVKRMYGTSPVLHTGRCTRPQNAVPCRCSCLFCQRVKFSQEGNFPKSSQTARLKTLLRIALLHFLACYHVVCLFFYTKNNSSHKACQEMNCVP